MSHSATPAGDGYREHCGRCGHLNVENTLCDRCGYSNRSQAHTHMAYGNTDTAGWYAIVADNWQWADPRSAFDRTAWATRASVHATLRACSEELGAETVRSYLEREI